METIIKVHPSELNTDLLKKIREFIGSKENIDVTISLKEFDTDYSAALNHSVEQAENNENIISMTMEEFVAYTPKRRP